VNLQPSEHHEHPPHLAHHFDTPEQQYEAASLGMWLFLVTEILFFGGLLTGYTVYRVSYPESFAFASNELNLWLGAVNTVVLLCSSLTMALAVHAAQTGVPKLQVAFLAATIVLGSVFLGIKVFEYWEKIEHHHVPGALFHVEVDEGRRAEGVQESNVELFFSFYFALTGLHALHMIIGIALLTVIAGMAWRGRFSAAYFTPVEMTGLYWHFVDIVWVFLFPLLYLIEGLHAQVGT
jgi:cytochrome c oxidase subunit III